MADFDLAVLGIEVRSDGVLVARDRLKGLEDQGKKTETATQRMSQMMQRSATTAAALGAAFGAATLAVAMFVRRQLDALDTLNDFASRLGISVEALQGLQYGAVQAGMTVDEFQISLQFFNRTLGEAVSGNVQASDAFGRLGLSAKALLDLPMEERLAVVADQMQKYGSASERAASIQELFGRSGAEMINFLEGGSRALHGFIQEANRLGVIIPAEQVRRAAEMSDRLDAIAFIFRQRLLASVIELIPLIEKMATTLSSPEFMRGVQNFAEGFTQVFQWVAEHGELLLKILGALAAASLGGKVGATLGAIGGPGGAAVGGLAGAAAGGILGFAGMSSLLENEQKTLNDRMTKEWESYLEKRGKALSESNETIRRIYQNEADFALKKFEETRDRWQELVDATNEARRVQEQEAAARAEKFKTKTGTGDLFTAGGGVDPMFELTRQRDEDFRKLQNQAKGLREYNDALEISSDRAREAKVQADALAMAEARFGAGLDRNSPIVKQYAQFIREVAEQEERTKNIELGQAIEKELRTMELSVQALRNRRSLMGESIQVQIEAQASIEALSWATEKFGDRVTQNMGAVERYKRALAESMLEERKAAIQSHRETLADDVRLQNMLADAMMVSTDAARDFTIWMQAYTQARSEGNQADAEAIRNLQALFQQMDQAQNRQWLIQQARTSERDLQGLAAGMGVWANRADQAAAIAMRQKELEIIEKMGDATDDLSQKIIRQTGEAARLKATYEDWQQTAGDLGNTLANGFEEAILSGRELSEVLENLFRDIERIIFRALVTKPLENLLTSSIGLMMNPYYDSGTGILWNQLPTRGANGLIMMQGGGLLMQPTMLAGGRAMGGEAGPEAVMPLERIGNKLGVNATMAAPKIEVHVHGAQTTNPRVQTSQNGQRIDIWLDEQMARNIRPGTQTHKAMRNVFGVSDQTIAR